jgi:hypothetical protein
MKTVCEVLGVSRSNLAVKSKRDAEWVDKRKTPARNDMPLVAELRGLVAIYLLTAIGVHGPCCGETGTRRVSLALMRNGFIGSCIPTVCCWNAGLAMPSQRAGTAARLPWTGAIRAGARTASSSVVMTARRCASSLHWTAATGMP